MREMSFVGYMESSGECDVSVFWSSDSVNVGGVYSE